VLLEPPLLELDRGEPAERRVGPPGVVLHPPGFDNDASFGERQELLDVEQLVSGPAVEGLEERVLPGAAQLDVDGPGAGEPAPVPQRPGQELGQTPPACLGTDSSEQTQATGL
jgi:hypothetical protein